MNKQDNYRLHAEISGQVQGVGFRYFVRQNAQDLNLTGWVRNLRDGRVEVTAEGQHHALNQLLVRLRKGPISAEVMDINYQFNPAKGEFTTFRVRHTIN